MNLSKIISYNRGFDDDNIEPLDQHIKSELDILQGKLETLQIQDYSEILSIRDSILSDMQKLKHALDDYKSSLHNVITQQEQEYFVKSYKIYEGMANDTPAYILDRTNPKSIDNSVDFADRIKLYSSWKNAGLYIRPGKNFYINEMIDSDPLYVVDEHLELLDPVKKLWTPEYQARLRYKIINEQSDQIFKNLPEQQIGLIVVSDFFDFKPFEVIKKYLKEFWDLLKPGGVVIFTYNNCDQPGAVRNVENFFNCYTPGRLIKDFVVGLDFELLNSTESASGINWLEIKKPGNLSSMRGGQTLAKIIKSKQDKI